MEGGEGESYGVVPSGKGGGPEISFHYGILRIQNGEGMVKSGNLSNYFLSTRKQAMYS